jgi:hypothetical protein
MPLFITIISNLARNSGVGDPQRVNPSASTQISIGNDIFVEFTCFVMLLSRKFASEMDQFRVGFSKRSYSTRIIIIAVSMSEFAWFYDSLSHKFVSEMDQFRVGF